MNTLLVHLVTFLYWNMIYAIPSLVVAQLMLVQCMVFENDGEMLWQFYRTRLIRNRYILLLFLIILGSFTIPIEILAALPAAWFVIRRMRADMHLQQEVVHTLPFPFKEWAALHPGEYAALKKEYQAGEFYVFDEGIREMLQADSADGEVMK